jgi:hypothetical protein
MKCRTSIGCSGRFPRSLPAAAHAVRKDALVTSCSDSACGVNKRPLVMSSTATPRRPRWRSSQRHSGLAPAIIAASIDENVKVQGSLRFDSRANCSAYENKFASSGVTASVVRSRKTVVVELDLDHRGVWTRCHGRHPSAAEPKSLYGSRRPGTHLAAFSSVDIRPGIPPSSPGDART